MNKINHIFSDEELFNVRILGRIKLDDDSYSRGNLLCDAVNGFVDLKALSNKNHTYRVFISLPSQEDLEARSDKLKEISDFLSQVTTDDIEWSSRIMYHLSADKYETDPKLPVVMEGKNRENLGRIMLNGIRITFPDFKNELETIILDRVVDLDDNEVISIQIVSFWKRKYSEEFLTDVIQKARQFANVFVCQKKKD